jgi:hypothetical protein
VEDEERGLTIAGAFLILACGLALRLTDRLWLVDLFDAPSFGEAGNFALGAVVAASWFVFPLVLVAVRRLTGSDRRSATTTPLLLVFATLGALAIAAYPNRRGGAYNDALDEQVPGFVAGMFAGTAPLLVLGACIAIANWVLSRRARGQSDDGGG